MPSIYCFFFLVFWRYKHINYFIWSLSFVSSKRAHFSYFTWLISLSKIFWGTYFIWWFRLFQDLFEYFFLKKYSFSSFFLLIFVVKFSFSKSVESISVLKRCPACAGILFFCHFFSGNKHLFYFLLSWFFVSR